MNFTSAFGTSYSRQLSKHRSVEADIVDVRDSRIHDARMAVGWVYLSVAWLCTESCT